MGSKNQNAPNNSGNSPADEDVQFDPSDYLPRRTSRASAQAASEAIKKSVKEDKIDPNRLTAPAEPAKSQRTKPPDSVESREKTTAKRKHCESECCIKLRRLEDDPKVKEEVVRLSEKTWIVRKRFTKINQNKDSNYVVINDDESPSSVKRREQEGKMQANGTDGSSYEVVFAPAYAKEKMGLNHILVGTGPQVVNKKGFAYVSTNASTKDLKLGPSGSKVRGASASGQKSLSLVVVHPKPGSKIVNQGKTSDSKSKMLRNMMSDPSAIISNTISRVMTTGGNVELRCSTCRQTFVSAHHLINHKRLVHKCTKLMCTSCADEFSTTEARDSHVCNAKYRCEICGFTCKQASHLGQHKRMAHKKTLGEYMCYVCCFNASSKAELDSHRCGGKPKNFTPPGTASTAVMVYPKWNVNAQPKSSTTAKPSNIYVNITANKSQAAGTNTNSSSGEGGMNFLCEVCLNMFPTSTALESHKCGPPTAVVDDNDAAATQTVPKPASATQPSVPLSMDVFPEVEELAKFYSSVVFKE